MTYKTSSNCITVGLFELHTQSIINFTQFDYIKDKQSLPFYEVFLKMALCLVSLIAALFGNLTVMYRIIIKSRKTNSFKMTNGDKRLSLKCESRFAPLETENLVFMSRNAGQIQYKDRKSFLVEIDQENVRVNTYSNLTYKSYKSKSVNFFILNLCFCDLMIVMWCSWVHMINSISQNWIFGAFFCKLNTFVQVICLIAAISTLSLISLERFKGIVCTMGKKIDHKKSIQAIVLIWLFSGLAAFPILIYRKQYKRIWKNHVEIWCSDAWPISYKFESNSQCIAKVNEPFRRVYYTFISFVLFFIPILIMLFSYCLIMRKLKKTKILRFFRENSSEKNILIRRRQKVNILLIGLIVSFMICWSPVQVLILFEAYKQFDGQEMPSWFNWVYFLVYLLAYTNSAINPVIYTGLNKFYRKARRRNMLHIANGTHDNRYE
ncbi:substance-P receptor-like [Brachionus plicatilis]|uniref:Substance-P receptor-like n=1 Tax=Brachionus plicatilis TaxID=10195 RepID=A0A3M7QM34_BRAPC|nr:substance-P receptor-like [Brachionus plicatilis]